MVDDDSVCGRDGYAEGRVCEGMGMRRDGYVKGWVCGGMAEW